MFFTFLVVVVLTAIALVAAAMTIAKLIAPRSFNPQKGEPYECGIPTRGQSWVQFKVGYYMYAILFLMFDIETVFLFPWAVTAGELMIGHVQYTVFLHRLDDGLKVVLTRRHMFENYTVFNSLAVC